MSALIVPVWTEGRVQTKSMAMFVAVKRDTQGFIAKRVSLRLKFKQLYA